MTGDRYRRADVLREVITAANRRQDGALPIDVAGVEAVFDDIDDLVGALLLRWHTRLAAELERTLASQPLDLEAAVIGAWRSTREQLLGVRLIFDALTEQRISPQLSAKLGVTARKDRALMAIMAGKVSYQDERAVPVGRRIEAKARAEAEPEQRPDDTMAKAPRSVLARIWAALVA